jgi:hypothetical protein
MSGEVSKWGKSGSVTPDGPSCCIPITDDAEELTRQCRGPCDIRAQEIELLKVGAGIFWLF